MADRVWKLRMTATYEGASNKVTALTVEHFREGDGWQRLDINVDSPGFLIFVYSLLSCQHLYMHTNAAEHGLVLARATGSMELVATQDWKLRALHVHFAGTLASGTPSQEAILDIQRRMNQCPVSRNIHVAGVHESLLTLT